MLFVFSPSERSLLPASSLSTSFISLSTARGAGTNAEFVLSSWFIFFSSSKCCSCHLKFLCGNHMYVYSFCFYSTSPLCSPVGSVLNEFGYFNRHLVSHFALSIGIAPAHPRYQKLRLLMCTTSEGKENKVAANTTIKSFPGWASSSDAFFFF